MCAVPFCGGRYARHLGRNRDFTTQEAAQWAEFDARGFVNVGRGELLDQSALTSALVGGRLGGAGLDVTTPEPLPDDDPLWTAPNVIITPHTSGSTDGTMRRSDQIFLDNLAAWRDGERLLTEVIP